MAPVAARRHVLDQALDAGHDVTVLVRNRTRLHVDTSRVPIVTGMLDDADAVDRAIAGADAVISAIGPDGNTPDQLERLRTGMRQTTAAIQRHGVRRMVNLSGAGITAPGEGKPLFDESATRIVAPANVVLVGARGFEPPTPWPPAKCAARLRHAPTDADQYSGRSVSRRPVPPAHLSVGVT